MPIVDAQVHLWGKGTTLPPHRATPYLADEALRDMDAAGVDRAVLHPPSWDADSNELSVEAARAHPDRFAILGRFALDRPGEPGAGRRLEGPAGHARPALYVPAAARRRAGRPTAPWTGCGRRRRRPACRWRCWPTDFLPLVGQIAERHPGLKLIVDHMGAVRGNKGDAAFVNLPQLLALAKHPNVAVKATGGPSYATDAYPFRSLHKPYRALYDAFGPQAHVLGHRHHAHALLLAGSASRISPSCRGSPRPTRS